MKTIFKSVYKGDVFNKTVVIYFNNNGYLLYNNTVKMLVKDEMPCVTIVFAGNIITKQYWENGVVIKTTTMKDENN